MDGKYFVINNIHEYVKRRIEQNAQVVLAEKMARIAARQGVSGEQIVSWSVDAVGNPVMEKTAEVNADDSGNPGWVATKVDDDGYVIVDQNGNRNQWIISDSIFRKKYEADQLKPGLYKPVGGIQRFMRLEEAITVQQWGKEWNVDAGGYVNITKEDDYYVISQRDFNDTYRIVQ